MNLLDSSGWIEYFAEGPNAERFAPVLDDTATLLVPTIVLHEVYRWADREGGELAASRAVATMQTGAVMVLNTDVALASARLARQHRLPTADSIIYASAQSRGAIVWTQDEDFRDLPGVRHIPKIKEKQVQ
ncbi:type II toxin-antitoxin system VapC family toxin [Thioalkalicoccus limnaeus]|uniref:Ribonuclease VapC n=1 Tax=Thioalkalicoccus limnaeus TaxID=120681 RepID=A0ABV4BIF1_9GAMM